MHTQIDIETDIIPRAFVALYAMKNAAKAVEIEDNPSCAPQGVTSENYTGAARYYMGHLDGY